MSPCVTCGRSVTIAAKGLCHRCYKYKKYGHGRTGPIATQWWTEDELAQLREAYARKVADVKGLAARLGRHPGNVSRKAREFGLTNQHRPKVEERKDPRKFKGDTAAFHEHISRCTRERIATKGHPRGALGLKHTPEAKAKMASAIARAWADPASALRSPEESQRRSDRLVSRVVARTMTPGHSIGKGGRRADLDDRYFRSRWEANYARYLNWLQATNVISGWEYECKTFVFESIKRGTRAYTPDFLVRYPGGHHEWHEVKGWMNQRSRTCLDRMGRYYPEEKVLVIDQSWFRSAVKNGLPALLPHWEFGNGLRPPRAGLKLKPNYTPAPVAP